MIRFATAADGDRIGEIHTDVADGVSRDYERWR